MFPPLLDISHLVLRFGGVTALQDVSFSVETGALNAIIGPNGAGKTSLLNCVSGVYRPQQGRIVFIEVHELTTRRTGFWLRSDGFGHAHLRLTRQTAGDSVR